MLIKAIVLSIIWLMKRSEFISYDKKTLSTLEWYVAEPKGLVLLVHSTREHAEKLGEFAEYLNSRGYLVYAFDLRCHGETDKERLGVSSGDVFMDTIKDMASLSKKFKEQYPRLKQAVFGRGFGAYLALAFTERYPRFVDACILCSVLKTDFLYVYRAICALFGKIKGSDYKSRLINKLLNTNDEISDSPSDFDYSNGFYSSYVRGIRMSRKSESLEKIAYSMPIMILSGTNDKYGKRGVAAKKLKEAFENIGVKAELAMYDGAYHDIFGGSSREKAWSDIAAFLDEKI